MIFFRILLFGVRGEEERTNENTGVSAATKKTGK